MAKTTKNNSSKKQTSSSNRRSTTKRTAQSRSTRPVVGSGGLKRLQFSRTQVLVVVLLVALVGGFLVYRGRAANAILALPGAAGETQECTSVSGVIAKETSGSKRNGSVCELTANKTFTPVRFGNGRQNQPTKLS